MKQNNYFIVAFILFYFISLHVKTRPKIRQFASVFTLSDNTTRGHCFEIQKQYSRVNCRAFSFANRCIDAWNSLDNDVAHRLFRLLKDD